MDVEQIWQSVHRERLRVADLLERLTPDEWRRPSLCAGWAVREVAAHLTMQTRLGPLSPLAEVIRARGNFNRMVDRTARALAVRPPERLVADLRAIAGSRRMGLTMKPSEALLDTLIHSQDIALPLGRVHDLPADACCVAADRVWAMGFPFRARRRLRGVRLVATDGPWTRGEGAEITGSIAAILLLVAGRTAVLPRLGGPGVSVLASRRPPTPVAAGR
jgi:uncharacterized protein (TIGR03083 family)